MFLPPANEVCEGYVFTPGCHSVPGGGVFHSACWDTPPRPEADTQPDQRQTPPGSRPNPFAVHAGRYGQHSGGTHPTGMHTCSPLILIPFQFDADTLGKNAKTVFRDVTGRRRNLKAEAAKDAEAARKKEQEQAALKAKYDRWGKG